ncbi:MAG: hypothetical protein Q4P20_08280 [Eubacteriales bacterium]|nr:hypothetical protein [Eubacteriales bacterium]
MKYDMTAIKYLEPSFLPLAKNRKSYVCPVCGSGTGQKGSGMTSKDGEYWKCWSCGQSYSKVELFRIQNSLSYEDACIGLLRHYGIVPTPIGADAKQSPVWLSREQMEALGFFQGGMQIGNPDGTQTLCDLTSLFNEDPAVYYSLVIARADEMIGKYETIFNACGSRNSPKAGLIYDYLGELFDDSSYQKIKQELVRKASICKSIRDLYAKRIKGVSK